MLLGSKFDSLIDCKEKNFHLALELSSSGKSRIDFYIVRFDFIQNVKDSTKLEGYLSKLPKLGSFGRAHYELEHKLRSSCWWRIVPRV